MPKFSQKMYPHAIIARSQTALTSRTVMEKSLVALTVIARSEATKQSSISR